MNDSSDWWWLQSQFSLFTVGLLLVIVYYYLCRNNTSLRNKNKKIKEGTISVSKSKEKHWCLWCFRKVVGSTSKVEKKKSTIREGDDDDVEAGSSTSRCIDSHDKEEEDDDVENEDENESEENEAEESEDETGEAEAFEDEPEPSAEAEEQAETGDDEEETGDEESADDTETTDETTEDEDTSIDDTGDEETDDSSEATEEFEEEDEASISVHSSRSVHSRSRHSVRRDSVHSRRSIRPGSNDDAASVVSRQSLQSVSPSIKSLPREIELMDDEKDDTQGKDDYSFFDDSYRKPDDDARSVGSRSAASRASRRSIVSGARSRGRNSRRPNGGDGAVPREIDLS